MYADEKQSRIVFGKNLSALLEEKQIAQKTLAKYMQVSTAAVSDWCKGKKMPKVNRLKSIANYLNVKLTDLTDEKTPSEANSLFEAIEKAGSLQMNYEQLCLEKFRKLNLEAKLELLNYMDFKIGQLDA